MPAWEYRRKQRSALRRSKKSTPFPFSGRRDAKPTRNSCPGRRRAHLRLRQTEHGHPAPGALPGAGSSSTSSGTRWKAAIVAETESASSTPWTSTWCGAPTGEAMVSLIRRRLLAAAAALPVVPAFAQTRPLTCGELTAQQTEGPFFKTNTPRRVSLVEPQSKAPRLIVSGQVLSARCRPVANALLDFWHADEDGEYDNRGFRYRGHQFTDAEGRYRETRRSEEHTSELQSRSDLVCRLLLEKKKKVDQHPAVHVHHERPVSVH